ncbi:phospholipase D-like domain-containing protein [Alkalicoccus luteus]|uniref:Cardiolipin synthase n=1 Tax=Alkalicoccus luteus TaxID=1237094 RepID=A0A969PPU3_9BACI|nr:phospholipase D-like domain-containing protein [Alkalicoccus luteus]NJP37350.1 cardiolipin synthase [Alkalicoccus luteus]
MRKLRWGLAAMLAWISLDLYIGKKRHKRRSGEPAPPVKTSGNAAFFNQGDELFTHMLQKMKQADTCIHMHFYIFRDDDVGREFLDVLMQKASEGLDVRLLLDWVGARLPLRTRRELKKSGVLFSYAQKPRLPFLFYSINERNHRKVTVIDNKHAYIGGFNAGNEYAGSDPRIGIWRDYHLYVTGAAIPALSRQFARDWQTDTREPLTIPDPVEADSDPTPLEFRSTDGAHVTDHLKELFAEAETSVFIGTPYYIPGADMHREVIRLAQRGIKVRILIPKHPDHPLVKDAAFPYFRELLDAGVEVRQFAEGFYHAKVILIDDHVIDITTANFDMRSFYINHEASCTIRDRSWITSIRPGLDSDFYEYGEPITYHLLSSRTWPDRLREKTATLISSWM